MLAAVEKAQEAKWTIIDTTTDTQVDEASKKLEADNFKGAFALIRATTTVFGNTSDLHAKSNFARIKEAAYELRGFLDWRSAGDRRRSSNFYRNRCTCEIMGVAGHMVIPLRQKA